MAPRNTRVNPETEVRSPARSFVQTLDNYYRPERDTRKEQAFQSGVRQVSGLFEEKAAQVKKQRNDAEYLQGVQDQMREQAGNELEGIKTGTIFRQHSTYYTAGLNESRGKASALKFKNDTMTAYQNWEGRFSDNPEDFRAWMADRVGVFTEGLGGDQYRLAGALPVLNEIAHNLAAQHNTFTNERMKEESFEAYSEITEGIFDGIASGEFDMPDENGNMSTSWEMVVDALAFEANDMYGMEGADANNAMVDTALKYAHIHNDPDAILALAKAHDSGKLKLSIDNRKRLRDGIDSVEASIEREANKTNSRMSAEEKERRRQLMNDWGDTLQNDPYADLPNVADVGADVWADMSRLQDTFIRSSQVENPQITTAARMAFEATLMDAATPQEKMRALNEFVSENPHALSTSDVASYMTKIKAETDPGSIINDQTVGRYRTTFGDTLAEFQLGAGFDINKSSFLRTQGLGHFNDYMLANAGKVDMGDAGAIFELTQKAEEYAIKQLTRQFPDTMALKSEESAGQPDGGLGKILGVPEALDGIRQEQEAADVEEFSNMATPGATEGEAPVDGVEQSAPEEAIEPIPLEEQDTPFQDSETEARYDPVREGFYGELIHRFTDGRDDRINLAAATEVYKSDPAFARELDRLGAKYNVDPGALMAVMDFETGGTFNPSIRNAAGSGATGLIQFMPATARSLGTTTAELAAMSRVEQMVYVEKYFDQFPSIKGGSIEDIYMAVLWPRAIGKPSGYAIFRAGTKAYEQNRGLDTNGDGVVTKYEAASKVAGKFFGYG